MYNSVYMQVYGQKNSNRGLNTLFWSTVEVQSPYLKKQSRSIIQNVTWARKEFTKQESHKMLNNMIAVEYKYSCIFMSVAIYGNPKDSA